MAYFSNNTYNCNLSNMAEWVLRDPLSPIHSGRLVWIPSPREPFIARSWRPMCQPVAWRTSLERPVERDPLTAPVGLSWLIVLHCNERDGVTPWQTYPQLPTHPSCLFLSTQHPQRWHLLWALEQDVVASLNALVFNMRENYYHWTRLLWFFIETIIGNSLVIYFIL